MSQLTYRYFLKNIRAKSHNHLTCATMQAANFVDYNKWMATKNSCTQLKKSCQKENQESQVALVRSPEFFGLQFLIHMGNSAMPPGNVYLSTDQICVSLYTGKFEQNSRTFQGLQDFFLQFSRTKNLGKMLIKVLKFFFKNARLR